MNIDEQELQEWVKSLRNTITSSGFGKISEEGIYWIIYEYSKLLENRPSDLVMVQKALNEGEVLTLWGDKIWCVESRYKDNVSGCHLESLLIWAKEQREL